MALTVLMMRRYIKANGHLTMDGTETKEDLRQALINLRAHTYGECRYPDLGTPIEALIPDPSILTVNTSKKRRVTTVDMSAENL